MGGAKAGQFSVGDAVTVMVHETVALPPAASVTLTVNENAPAVDGVPLTSPVDGEMLSPAGSCPLEIENVNGAVPPVKPTLCE